MSVKQKKTDKEEQTLIIDPPQYAQQPLIERIVAYFNDEGPNPCSIAEAIVSMDMMDAFTQNKVQMSIRSKSDYFKKSN